MLGAKVRTPTLSGEVEIAIPPGTSSGRVLRLRGKGLPALGRGAGRRSAGDAAHRLAAEEDADLAALMRRWRDEKPYDPRAGMTG